jgi:hypothetical protein
VWEEVGRGKEEEGGEEEGRREGGKEESKKGLVERDEKKQKTTDVKVVNGVKERRHGRERARFYVPTLVLVCDPSKLSGGVWSECWFACFSPQPCCLDYQTRPQPWHACEHGRGSEDWQQFRPSIQ